MADAVGLKAEDSVGAWETRGVEPRDPVKRAVATVLGVPYEWLVGETDSFGPHGDLAPSAIRERMALYPYLGRRLTPKAYEVIYGYMERLQAAGFSSEEMNEAEQFLFNGAYNKINAREPGEKSEEDLILDIKAAWQFVRDVANRRGKKL